MAKKFMISYDDLYDDKSEVFNVIETISNQYGKSIKIGDDVDGNRYIFIQDIDLREKGTGLTLDATGRGNTTLNAATNLINLYLDRHYNIRIKGHNGYHTEAIRQVILTSRLGFKLDVNYKKEEKPNV